MPIRRFKATIEYDGTEFAGFQWQKERRTIQGTLEAAIEKRTGQAIRLTGAGRTDAGVHALGQVVSFGVETAIPLARMALALNSALPEDLVVRCVEEVGPEFNARFSASSRLYAYLILNRRMPSALWRRYSALCVEPLDVQAMQAGAEFLLGEQDFASLTNELKPGETTMREVMRCQVGRFRGFVLVRIEANAFLRGMVRATVGTLMEVGMGRRTPDDIRTLLEAKDRRLAGPSAPPQGLCLLRVRYGMRKVYPRSDPTAVTAEGSEE
jgi:tRNA pseudouridine38-40 synthase